MYVPAYAFDTALEVKRNIYDNERLNDAQALILQLKHNDFYLFGSYENPYLRLMGLSVTSYKILGLGIGYKFISCGVYFPNTDVENPFNEGIHRYLNHLFADPNIRYWDCYDVEASPGLGFNLTWKWEKEIKNCLFGFLAGYRFLRIPVKYLGWDAGYKGDSNHGWWHSIETENLSCAIIGFTFEYKF